jgi:hypothetical protein
VDLAYIGFFCVRTVCVRTVGVRTWEQFFRGTGNSTMEVLGNVMGILDMDGFCIGGRFFCKELGIWKVGDVYAESFFF